MCGIVGFIGSDAAAPVLLDGLSRLEYRGYDSAGIAVLDPEHGMQVIKAKGRLKVLSDIVRGGQAVSGSIGIGHTRWATHGEPSNRNAHPHQSQSGKIAVVHNGIIENYQELRQHLTEKGMTFHSQTDTEVIAQLLDYYYHGDILDTVYKVTHRIEGSYALGIICVDYPDQIIAVRKDSPLVLGYCNGSSLMASDVTALIRYTRDVSYMEDGEIAVLKRTGIQVYDPLMQPIEKEHSTVNWNITDAEKGGYPHFMFKEIMEQPESVRKTIFPRIRGNRVVLDELSLTADDCQRIEKLCIVACGSSYHVGMAGRYVLETLLRRPVDVCLASEFRYSAPILDEGTLVIVISQSGETLDTIYAQREAKSLGAHTLALVNVVASTIAKEADDVLYTWAGPEIAVATTKAYSTQLTLLYLIGLFLGDAWGTVDALLYNELLQELLRLPSNMETILNDKKAVQKCAAAYFNHDSIFFIGRNVDYAVGLEGSLKLKEISYIHSEAYAAGELKHGTISLVEKGTLVVALASYPPLFEKTVSNIVEVRSRGASILGITDEPHAAALAQCSDGIFVIPETHPMLLGSLEVIPLQLFAYYVALMRGCDIDKPRNLAKSVTVE